MSYDKSKSRNWRIERESEDRLREDFLAALNSACCSIGGVIKLTDFEAQFVSNFINGSQWYWTGARRTACDKMRKQYGGRL